MFLRMIGLAVVLVLVGCGGSGSGNNIPEERPASIVSGTAFDGLIVNGIINVYAYDGGVKGELLGSGTTDDSGLYSISIVSADRPILIEVTGGRYIEEASGSNVSLVAADDDRLTGVAYYVSGQPITMSLTYYTHLAVGLAEYLISIGGDVRTAIESANTRMSDLLGIDITLTTPLDVTLFSNATPVPTPGHLYGMATAAVSQYTKFISEENRTPIHSVYTSIAFARMAYEDIRADGRLNGQGDSGLLSLGTVAVTPETYRHMLATNMFVMASSERNNTGLTSADVLNTVVALNSASDIIFDGVTPIPLGDTAPQISNVSVTEGQTVWQTVSISADVTDIAGIDSVELRLDDVLLQTFSAGEAVDFALDTTSYSDAAHKISLVASNVFNGVTQVDINLIFFNGQTVISNIAPPDGAYLRGLFSMTAGVGDPLGLSEVQFLLDGVPFILAVDKENPAALFASSNYVDGAHIVELRATNTAGFITSESVNYIFDNTDPVAAISSVVSGDVLSGMKVLNFTASDNLALERVELHLDSSVLASFTTFGALNFALDTLIYPEGVHILGVTAVDKAGSSKTSNYNVTIDQSPPTLSITNPLAGDIISGVFTVRAEVADANGISSVEVLLNGDHFAWTNTSAPETRIDSSLACTLNGTCLGDGPVTITVKATDTVGKVTEQSVDVVFDNTAPMSIVNASYYGKTFDAYRPSCPISGSTNDYGSGMALLSINGVDFPIDGEGRNWSYRFFFPSYGRSQTLTLVSSDVVGNTKTTDVCVRIDLQRRDYKTICAVC